MLSIALSSVLMGGMITAFADTPKANTTAGTNQIANTPTTTATPKVNNAGTAKIDDKHSATGTGKEQELMVKEGEEECESQLVAQQATISDTNYIMAVFESTNIEAMDEQLKHSEKESVRGCLAGVQDIVDLSDLIPTIKGVNLGTLKDLLQKQAKNIIAQQKEKMINRVCNIADTALKNSLGGIQEEISRLKKAGEIISDPTAIVTGVGNTYLQRFDEKLDNVTQRQIDRLEQRANKLESQAQKVADKFGDKASKVTDKVEEIDNTYGQANSNGGYGQGTYDNQTQAQTQGQAQQTPNSAQNQVNQANGVIKDRLNQAQQAVNNTVNNADKKAQQTLDKAIPEKQTQAPNETTNNQQNRVGTNLIN